MQAQQAHYTATLQEEGLDIKGGQERNKNPESWQRRQASKCTYRPGLSPQQTTGQLEKVTRGSVITLWHFTHYRLALYWLVTRLQEVKTLSSLHTQRREKKSHTESIFVRISEERLD